MGFAESLVALQQQQQEAKPAPVPAHRVSVTPRDLSAVYVADDAYAWLPAHIVKTDGDKITVNIALPKSWHDSTVISPKSTIQDLEDSLDADEEDSSRTNASRIVNLKDYPRRELPLQNVRRSMGKRDMADLPFLHEAAILYNLKQRHYDEQPYTRVGDIVVAMNPFTWMHELYSQKTRDLYARCLVWEAKLEEDEEESTVGTFGSIYDKLGFDPHVYETSCLAYRGLALSKQNQTILVTGESGAGKTETVKIVMSHLATLEQTRPFCPTSRDNETVIMRVLESSPVFEAFGNAKTIRNDNSSRFGKFTQLQFRLSETPESNQIVPSCSLAGSVCVTYLLEKSRVVGHSPGERSYHIFYQLMAAPNEYKRKIWKQLDGATVDDFRYLIPCDVYEIDGESDEEQWPRTLEALKVFQFEGNRLETLLRALCVVLQLGNLTFDHDPAADHEEGGTVITSVDELDVLAELIGIPGEVLESCMTMRLIKTGYDEVNVQLRPSVAKESCDALAKEIYAQMFDVLVRKINEYTSAEQHKKHQYGLISLLDIFGFERFKVNRFEQLCINYANERLQGKYVLDNFRQVQEEYEQEGIDLFDFKLIDNSDVLNLLEGRLGLIISLNEECLRPKGNDESFVYKIKIVHKEHDRLLDEKLHRRTEFGVKHFAGPVTYDSTKFVERNTDKLPDGLLYCAAKSTNKLIREEFENLVAIHEESESSGLRKKKHRTVLEKFRVQLKHLMDTMEGTSTRYIRCIKPNETHTPRVTDHHFTMRQLECAGLVTAIAISRESFPNRLGYDAIRDRFDVLLSDQDRKNIEGMGRRDTVNYMLSNLLPSMAEMHGGDSLAMPFACGKTRVYFRSGALELLETMRLDYYTRRVVKIQSWFRRIQAKTRFIKMKDIAIKVQALARGRIEWQRHRQRKAAALSLQCWFRGLEATAAVNELRRYRAAILIQSRFRARKNKVGMERFKRAVRVIQQAIRNKKRKTMVTSNLAIAVEEARMDHKLVKLKKRVSERSLVRANDEADLLMEVESMFDYMRNEIFELRRKNADLRAEADAVETKKRDINAHAESAEAVASSSRLQVAHLTKVNSQLMSEVSGQRHEISALRKELKNVGNAHAAELAAIQSEHGSVLKEHELMGVAMQKSVEKCKRHCEREKKLLKDQIVELERVHKEDRLRLKEELKKTQESHHEYLVKLMDVLDTTHAAREEETARISDELNAVKEEKDSLIAKLQREVATLRQGGQGAVIREDLKKKERELKNIRKDKEKDAQAREQRSQTFFEVAVSLEQMLGSGGSPIKQDKKRRSIVGGGSQRSTKAPSEEDIMRMKQMVRYLGELYSLEENSQAKTDAGLMQKLDEYLATSGPNAVIAELESRVSSVERENALLREELHQALPCRRCEARQQKRRERTEGARSPDEKAGRRKSHSRRK